MTIKQFIEANRITIKSEMVNNNPHMDNSDNMDNYKCVLTLRGAPEDPGMTYCRSCGREWLPGHVCESRKRGAARMTLYFSKGMGHSGAEPRADEVLSCLALDAAGIEDASGDFDAWCSEYGYDTDSRKAEKIFKTCEHQAARLKNFLGDDLYDQLLWHTEAL